MQPQTREEKLRDILQVIRNNVHLLGEIESILDSKVDEAAALLRPDPRNGITPAV